MAYEVIVVGGGPAAVSAAMELEKKKVDYAIIYPKSFIKVCGGLLTPETISWLEKKGLEDCVKKSLVKPEITDLTLIDLIQKELHVKKDYITNIDRQKFDEELSNNLKPERKIDGFVNDIEYEDRLYKVKYNDSIIESKHIIYATGSKSKFLEKTPKVMLQDYYEVDGKNIDNNLFVLHEKINGFYLWIIPKGSYLIIGSLAESRAFFEPIMRESFDFLGYNINIRGMIKREAGLMVFPERNYEYPLYKDGMLFVGESAGLISRKTGKGIYYALLSGELAGKYYDSPKIYAKSVEPLLQKVREKIYEADQIYRIPI